MQIKKRRVAPPGSFARDHQRILEAHGWDHLHQEVLVSTPRRFGKTISISMFSAALIYSCPDIRHRFGPAGAASDSSSPAQPPTAR